MKSKVLSGYGIKINVDDGKLVVTDGREFEKEPVTETYHPKHADMDNITIYGHSGTISLDAIRWMSKMNIQVNVLDYNGKFLSALSENRPKNAKTKLAQFRAYENDRLEIARKLIEAKVKTSSLVIEKVGNRFPQVGISWKSNEKHIEKVVNKLFFVLYRKLVHF